MGKVSEDDEEQLEYIRKWWELKENQKEERLYRKRMRKYHMNRAFWYLGKALQDVKMYFKWLFRKVG